MKLSLPLLTLALGAVLAVPALALDLQSHPNQVNPTRIVQPTSAFSVLGCDNGVTWGGWFQYADDRLGNVFNFGSGGALSSVSFTHYDYGTVGPYNYDVEVWDPASCTLVAGKYNLVAASSVYTNTVETVSFCGTGINVAGSMFVGIHAKTCNSPTDCYPNLVYDNQLFVACPVIINDATTAPACYDVSAYGGPFLLRTTVNECSTPTNGATWGRLKSIYR